MTPEHNTQPTPLACRSLHALVMDTTDAATRTDRGRPPSTLQLVVFAIGLLALGVVVWGGQ